MVTSAKLPVCEVPAFHTGSGAAWSSSVFTERAVDQGPPKLAAVLLCHRVKVGVGIKVPADDPDLAKRRDSFELDTPASMAKHPEVHSRHHECSRVCCDF